MISDPKWSDKSTGRYLSESVSVIIILSELSAKMYWDVKIEQEIFHT